MFNQKLFNEFNCTKLHTIALVNYSVNIHHTHLLLTHHTRVTVPHVQQIPFVVRPYLLIPLSHTHHTHILTTILYTHSIDMNLLSLLIGIR